MKRNLNVIAVGLLASFLLGALSIQPAVAGEGQASTAHASMTFDFPDVVFDASEGCITPSFNVEVKATIPSTDWFVEITMRKDGQSPTGSEGRADGRNSGPAVGTIQHCSSLDGTGTFIVDGVLTTFDNETNGMLKTSFVSSVEVRKGKSALVLSSLKRTGSKITLAGKVTGSSEKYGMVGLTGPVRVDYQLKNSKKWLALTNVYSDKSGKFKAAVVKSLPKKILFRVTFVATESMESSTIERTA
jgi:hypothetical protein